MKRCIACEEPCVVAHEGDLFECTHCGAAWSGFETRREYVSGVNMLPPWYAKTKTAVEDDYFDAPVAWLSTPIEAISWDEYV